MSQTQSCFHCGDPIPDGEPILAKLGDTNHPMCCLGCKAVAEFIAGSGLTAFYEFRSKPDAELDLTPTETEWQYFDDPDLLGRYVSQRNALAEASVDIGGMYCSACVWLLDKALQQIPAVDAVDVNPAVRRAVIRWDSTTLKFSELLQAISRVGFKPAPVGVGKNDGAHTGEHRLALKRLIVAAAAGMQVMMFAVALYAGDYFGIEPHIEQFLRVISFVVTLPILLFSARPFFAGAWRGIRARSPGMDLPVSVAILAAFGASTIATWAGSGEIYFDSVAMFVFFLSATRYLEMRARHQSDDHATALAQLLPDTAIRVVAGVASKVALDRLRIGDVVNILPGEVVPVDGEVLSGTLEIDESMLSGESNPVLRETGDAIFAGAQVVAGNASVRVLQTGAGTSLAEIGRMLERARAERPPIAMLADRIAGLFVLAVLSIATVSGLAWYYIDAGRAFSVVLAVLVVTCPCALALATPAALAAATTQLARNGLLLVRSRILAVLSQAKVMVFDKTGTLTEGRPVVVNTASLVSDIEPEKALGITAAIESVSEHVLARAFATHYDATLGEPSDITVTPGSGVEAVLAEHRYRVGKLEYVAELSASHIADFETDSLRTPVFLGDEDQLLARFDIDDELRADAKQAISELLDLGYTPVIASGDHASTVAAVAEQLGIERWHAKLTPADKLALLDELRQPGDAVIMIGDGINDAPVLAAADASIALDSGTALARASADAVSLSRKLGTINMAVGVAAQTQQIIRQNIAWAIIYNATAVPLAVSGLLLPWMAAIGMSLSSLIVVFNALRLQRSPESSS